MKEIGIFEVEKGKICGIVNVPRKIIKRKVKVFLIEEKDETSQIDHQITLLENDIRDLEYKRDNLLTLKKMRSEPALMTYRSIK